LRVGVVGCGYWGANHLRVLQQLPDVTDVVAVEPRPERRAELIKAAVGVRPFPDLESALPYLDAVVVATPPLQHSTVALQALLAGKHVLVEKPMTTSSVTARRLIDEASARHLTLMVGHTFEYNAAVWKLREVIESGELGQLYYIDAARLNLGIYQRDVNVMWDLAPHDISILNYLLRSTPGSVQAWASRNAQFAQEDVAYLRLGYDNPSVRAQIHVSWLDPCKVRRVTVVGSRKMAVYNDLGDQEKLRIYDKGLVLPEHGGNGHPPLSYRQGDISSPYIDFREPLRVQDEHFVECVRTGRRPRSDGESGFNVVRVLEAATGSMKRDAAVHIGGEARLAALRPARSVDLLERGA